MHDFNGMGFGMGWGWIIGFILLASIIWIVVRYANQNNRTNQTASKSALDILNERYARGEINKNEYDEIKKSIS